MLTRLMDLVVLVAEMSQEKDRSYRELDAELVSQGYTSAEIEQAVFWFSSLQDAEVPAEGRGTETVTSGPIQTISQRPVRVLSEFERMSVDAESYGFMLRLLNLGILSLDQFEQVIARAIPVGPEKIRLSDVKTIASAVLFNRETDDGEYDSMSWFDDEESAT
jgi:uncharacterized protein Smg (DUF494 family)